MVKANFEMRFTKEYGEKGWIMVRGGEEIKTNTRMRHLYKIGSQIE